tara:strand:- start:5839 stop:6648 length:810 start_codon:yes stop_codon:yes gene_type:complete
MRSSAQTARRVIAISIIAVLTAGGAQAIHTGVGGDANNDGDVALAGCTCHAEEPDNSVTLILTEVPHRYVPGDTYEMVIQIIGGPDADTTSHTGGFSMRVSSGVLAASVGSESLMYNWEDDPTTLTHTDSGSKEPDRTWQISWTAPEEATGVVTIWLAGNSVNGDGVPSQLDRWNRLSALIDEGEFGGTRTVFVGNGDIEPPAPVEEGVDLHHMGAGMRAHWLGLLGFAAVVIVIIFCGLMLRYGFSRHYEGRSNLLRLRIKHQRRGDQ